MCEERESLYLHKPLNTTGDLLLEQCGFINLDYSASEDTLVVFLMCIHIKAETNICPMGENFGVPWI